LKKSLESHWTTVATKEREKEIQRLKAVEAKATKRAMTKEDILANQKQKRKEKIIQQEENKAKRFKKATEANAKRPQTIPRENVDLKINMTQKQENELKACATATLRCKYIDDWKKWTRWWAKQRDEFKLLMSADVFAALVLVRDDQKEANKTIKKWKLCIFQSLLLKLTEQESAQFVGMKPAAKFTFYKAWFARAQKKRCGEEDNDAPKPKRRLVKCKTLLDMYTQKQRTLTDVVSDLSNSDLPFVEACAHQAVVIPLFPTTDQKKRLRQFIGVYRHTYNQTVSLHNDKKRCKEIFGLETPPFQDLRKHVLTMDQKDATKKWIYEVAYNQRELAPREFEGALKIARKNQQSGSTFRMKFKAIKKSRAQTIPLGARSITISKQGFRLFAQSDSSVIKYNISSHVLKGLVGDAESTGKAGWYRPMHGCKLVYDRGNCSYFLHVPVGRTQSWVNEVDTCTIENQDQPRVISLDPGVRTFLTGYSPSSGETVEFAPQAVQRLCRVSHHIDKLSKQMDRMKKPKKSSDWKKYRLKIRKLKRKRLCVYTKVKNLCDEVHWQTASYLCKNFDVILIPEFGVSDMVKKRGKNGSWKRDISKNTSRRMLLLAHYRFRQRLLNKAKQYGRNVVIVNEAYTTKTCTRCGVLNNKVGGKKTFICNDCYLIIGRDDNGARNILLRNI
jgi:IS605 OrfB family transposase